MKVFKNLDHKPFDSIMDQNNNILTTLEDIVHKIYT
jgi:hypothetical protein